MGKRKSPGGGLTKPPSSAIRKIGRGGTEGGKKMKKTTGGHLYQRKSLFFIEERG